MTALYPLVGKPFAIIEGSVISAVGKIVQGSGGQGYLVRFETTPPYSRIYPFDAPFFTQINLFDTDDELGDFIEFFHKNVAPANDAARVTPEALGKEEELSVVADVEPEDTPPAAA